MADDIIICHTCPVTRQRRPASSRCVVCNRRICRECRQEAQSRQPRPERSGQPQPWTCPDCQDLNRANTPETNAGDADAEVQRND